MRVLQLLAILIVVAVVVYFLLRQRSVAARSSGGRASQPALPDELVKDPICGTYVVRSRAIAGVGADGPIYFCSPECARRHATETRG